MEDSNCSLRTIDLSSNFEKENLRTFLAAQKLSLDADVEYSLGMFDEEQNIVAAGSISGRVLKCIAVDEKYRDGGLTNKIVTELILVEYHRYARHHLFVYTSPSNEKYFRTLGFYPVHTVPEKVTLLENDPEGISGYLAGLRSQERTGKRIAAIVVNCNPFTLGHRYLIETAAAGNDTVHVFVVTEDRSVFPAEARLRLVVEGTTDLANVQVHPGGDYIISQATFPSYFLKESKLIVETHAELDLGIFATRIAPALGITRRYVGEEPFDPVTKNYNETMKALLPGQGIEVIEIPRKEIGGRAVSASRIRELAAAGRLEEIRELVPLTTYGYLVSREAETVIKSLKRKTV